MKKKDYVMIHIVKKDCTEIYRHYRHPITGTLANSGKIEKVAVIWN